MLSKITVLGQSVARVDLVGVMGATKKFKTTLRPKISGGATLDLTGCVVRAAFKQEPSASLYILELSSLVLTDKKITVTILPPSTGIDLKSVVEFKLTSAMTRLLTTPTTTRRPPVWSMEYEEPGGDVYPLFAGECRFSGEIV